MYFTVRAVTRADYDAWVEEEIEAANARQRRARRRAAHRRWPATLRCATGWSATAGGEVLQVATHAETPVAFDQTTLTAPAGAGVHVEYLNDADVPHNIAFFEGSDSSAPRIAATAIVAGPGALEDGRLQARPRRRAHTTSTATSTRQMTGTFEVVS